MAAKGPTLSSHQPPLKPLKQQYVRIGKIIRTVGKGICTGSHDLEERVQVFGLRQAINTSISFEGSE